MSVDGRRKSQRSALEAINSGKESGASRFREQVRASFNGHKANSTVIEKFAHKGGSKGQSKGGKGNP